MQLTVRDVAEWLDAPEKTIYRWIREGSIPAHKVQDTYRFNRSELLAWATAQRIEVSRDLMQPAESEGTSPALSAALEAGGVFHDVDAIDKEGALRAVVDLMRLPEQVDRGFLLQVLLAREALASTGLGDGIAVPHVRNPIVLQVAEPMVSLCFLRDPIDFGAIDGQPVYCLFTMVSPTVRTHLQLLSRLSYALRDADFLASLKHREAAADILTEMRRVETALDTQKTAAE